MAIADKQAAFLAGAGALPRPKGVSFAAHTADQPESDWLKILAYGHSGAGKTTALYGFLKAGLKVFVASTDIGGDGLRSVKALAASEGRKDLLANLASFDFPSYMSLESWLKEPNLIRIGDKDLWSWNPDMLSLEGFSNWQERHLGDYIMEQSPMGKASDLREAGLLADQQDWGACRKGTLRTLDRFLIIHNPNGKKLHKYVTCLEDNSKADKLTGEVYKGPLIMGSARSYLAPAFDLIVEMKAKGGKYTYVCGASSNSLSKRRGLPVNPEEPGDMAALWAKLADGIAAK